MVVTSRDGFALPTVGNKTTQTYFVSSIGDCVGRERSDRNVVPCEDKSPEYVHFKLFTAQISRPSIRRFPLADHNPTTP